MTITYPDFQPGEERFAPDIPSTRRQVLEETFASTFEENPIMAFMRWNELRQDEKTGPKLDAATARQRIKDQGFEGHLTVGEGGITDAALETLMSRKRTERRRAEVFSRSQGGLVEGAQRFGLSALTTLADPISAGLNFVPYFGQARYARWLANASLLQRVGVRAGVGAVEGAVGGAIAEVPVYAMRRSEQADYGLVDSLMNVSLGAVTGAGLHATVGTAGEGIEAFRARRSPVWSMPGLSYGERLVEQRARRRAMNVDAVDRDYAKLEGTDGGRIINTDLARELSPEYRADRTLSSAVHNPSSYITEQLYARRLAEAPRAGEEAEVLFTAGGAGAGKSTGLELMHSARGAKPQIVFDTTLDKLPGSIQKIDQALTVGKRVQIAYTFRDPVDALTNGALLRAQRMGRTVPLDVHARTHVDALETIRAIAKHYETDPRVQISVIDNSRGEKGAQISQLEALPTLEYNRVREDLQKALDSERAAGRISDAVYRATLGRSGVPGSLPGTRGSRGQVAQLGPQRQALNATAAERAALASPEVREAALRAAVGQAVTGERIDVDAILEHGNAENAFASAQAHQRDSGSTPDPEFAAALRHADEILDKEPVAGDAESLLKTANEEADLAVAEAKAIAKRLDVEDTDPELAAADELVEQAEKWAKSAEIATTCLIRGS